MRDWAFEWRDIPGFPGYQVSTAGDVRRSAPGNAKTFIGKVLTPQKSSAGYPIVSLTIGGRKKSVEVHRLVALAFLGKPPTARSQVAHWDGNRSHSAVHNFRWASAKENCADTKRHGRHPAGERNGGSKLKAEHVALMREMRVRGETLATIGNTFGVAFQTVSKIVRGERWAEVANATQ